VAGDDILNALVAAVTAYLGKQSLLTLPEKPADDLRCLPMEMVYYSLP
jgi:predicted RNase H-like nuclease